MDLAERAEELPTGPGVYLFKSERGKVLYVGKAQNLRARVRTYIGGGDGRVRIPHLLDRARDIDVVVTPTVKDALLLENELIKQHKPPFNVRLRDDKQYLALRLDPREEWPRLTQVRRFREDGAHYFGPYDNNVAMRDALSNLRRIFPLRSCREGVFRDYARRGRPCIEYEMKRCVGPCCGLVEPEKYQQLVAGTALFLRGRSDELVAGLRSSMADASAEERYEDAARVRDQIAAVERTVERQRIVDARPVDRDVFGLARQGGEVAVQVLHVREGRVVGTQSYGFSDVRLDDGEVMSSFLGQFYGDGELRPVPPELLTPSSVDDEGALTALLSEKSGRRVSLREPRRGAPAELVTMANANAALELERRMLARDSIGVALDELTDRLGLRARPGRIEGYDISSLNGTLAVGSRVAFEDGLPAKKDYRRYKIREAAADDDYACLREVLRRRFARVDSEPLPDLLMIDGGKGQLGVLTAALADAGLECDAISLSKERDAESPSPRVRRSGGLKAERVFVPGRKDAVMLPPSSRGLLLLQRVRDESHRFAIEYQRDLRARVGMTSILEELPGIGPTKRRALLRGLGSLRAVRAATAEQLAAVQGVSVRDAELIRRFYDAVAQPQPQADGEPAVDAGSTDAVQQAAEEQAPKPLPE